MGEEFNEWEDFVAGTRELTASWMYDVRYTMYDRTRLEKSFIFSIGVATS
jgi:hypothetical protein